MARGGGGTGPADSLVGVRHRHIQGGIADAGPARQENVGRLAAGAREEVAALLDGAEPGSCRCVAQGVPGEVVPKDLLATEPHTRAWSARVSLGRRQTGQGPARS